MGQTIHQLIIIVIGCLGLAVVGSAIGILWYRITSPGPLERDTVLFNMKMFFGIGASGIVMFLIVKFL